MSDELLKEIDALRAELDARRKADEGNPYRLWNNEQLLWLAREYDRLLGVECAVCFYNPGTTYSATTQRDERGTYWTNISRTSNVKLS